MAELDLSVDREALNRLADAAERAEKAIASLQGLVHSGVRIRVVGEVAEVQVFGVEPEYTVLNTVAAGKPVLVTLDGQELKNVVAADTRHGFVDVQIWEDENTPRLDSAGMIATERKFGKVVVTPM